MNISETFIERPIATSLLMAAIALFGAVAYRSLPVSDLPNVDFPTLLVTASLPGASPETMAPSVATPLENQFSTIAGLESMTSVNSLGTTQITLEFDLNRNLDGAAVDVQARDHAGLAPAAAGHADAADLHQGESGRSADSLPRADLANAAAVDAGRVRRDPHRAAHLDGHRRGAGAGARRAEVRVHVQMDPHALASRQIGINEVETALKNWNVNLPTGTIIGPQRAFTLQATGQLMSAEQYRPLVVAYRNGSPVRLEELGNIIDSVEDDKTASWFYTPEGERARHHPRHPAPARHQHHRGDRRRSRTCCRCSAAELPPSVKMDILYDRSDTIRESYHDVQFTMLLTLGLVVMVIFLFLRNVSATVIPSLALPFSIIGTFAVMYLLDYSLDNLSMMALILSIGFVVDDAIVMLENIVRHMEMGERAADARR